MLNKLRILRHNKYVPQLINTLNIFRFNFDNFSVMMLTNTQNF